MATKLLFICIVSPPSPQQKEFVWQSDLWSLWTRLCYMWGVCPHVKEG